MKKLLVLGAMQMHIPLLKRAKERGIYVLTCDYYKDVEGHRYADEPHYDSTTDLDAVLNLAKEGGIDAITTFNSDPAALTVAYVSEHLGLPGNKFNTVKLLSEKDLFRRFLRDNGFNVPFFQEFSDKNSLLKNIDKITFPSLMKPVDSSGSKGVSVVTHLDDIILGFQNASNFSRCKRVIVEEYIECKGAQLHGDAFIVDGNVVFSYLGDHHFDYSINNLVPYATSFPSKHTSEEIKAVEDELQRVISAIGFIQGGINIEARISKKDNKIYFIEIGPRNGGNFTPIIIQHASGFNFIDATIDSALGIPYTYQNVKKEGYYSYLIPHSKENGTFVSVEFSKELQSHIMDSYVYKKVGDEVVSFRGANAAIGVLLMKYNTMEQMDYFIKNFDDHYKVTLK